VDGRVKPGHEESKLIPAAIDAAGIFASLFTFGKSSATKLRAPRLHRAFARFSADIQAENDIIAPPP
jgi:hypothetical protein